MMPPYSEVVEDDMDIDDYDPECEFEWLVQEECLAQRSRELQNEMDNRLTSTIKIDTIPFYLEDTTMRVRDLIETLSEMNGDEEILAFYWAKSDMDEYADTGVIDNAKWIEAVHAMEDSCDTGDITNMLVDQLELEEND